MEMMGSKVFFNLRVHTYFLIIELIAFQAEASTGDILVESNFVRDMDGWFVTVDGGATKELVPTPLEVDKATLRIKAGDRGDLVWYFNAPNKFLGDQGSFYHGALEYTLVSPLRHRVAVGYKENVLVSTQLNHTAICRVITCSIQQLDKLHPSLQMFCWRRKQKNLFLAQKAFSKTWRQTKTIGSRSQPMRSRAPVQGSQVPVLCRGDLSLAVNRQR
jgi:hypothetical protein